MIRVLALLAVVGFGVYALLRYVDSLPQRTVGSAGRAGLPARDPADLEEPAALAHGPDRGHGLLRLTPSQLIFASDSGRVLTIERLDVTGVTTTRELPDRRTLKPVLAITTAGDVHYFAVNDPARWESRLL
ncbi:MAG TPA: hypothetical protein PLT68_01965 [Actinomycetota bacterium]|nr:hypothetical protein [Actinomycetota bacterium]